MLPGTCSCTLMASCVHVARLPIFVCMSCACVVHHVVNVWSISVVHVWCMSVEDLYGEGEYVKFRGHTRADRSGEKG
jgi:hypothetical protein